MTYLCLSALVLPATAADGFTQADRERMVRVEATLVVFMQQVDKRFEELRTDMNTRFEQVDKRFEQVDKRFEQVDKRFEQVDKRFEELRSDMNTRFEEHRTDMNTRFEQMTNMFYAISAIFTTLFAAVFSFAWWDRRSILITARKTAREEVEEAMRADQNSRNTLSQLIEALKNFAEKTPDLKESMRRVNLL
jgi:uncharacterized protein HemX